MIGLYTVLCLLIIAIEVPGLLRRQHYRELYVFTGLLLIGFVMGLAFYMEWPLFKALDALTSYFDI